MESNVPSIKKIPLDNFIDILMDLYNKGVDYIDIIAVPEGDDERMAITFTSDYMMEGAEDNFKDAPSMDFVSLKDEKLSEEDLDQLI
jgi:hypothetical protein